MDRMFYAINPVSYTHLNRLKILNRTHKNIEEIEELTEKIVDTNLRIDTLENNFKQALHEQVVRIENKQKELRLEWRKDLKEIASTNK